METLPERNAVALTDKKLVCLQVGDLPVTVIPVYMAVVGCPISSLRNTCYSVAPFQKEPIIRCPASALVSGSWSPPLAVGLGCLCWFLVLQLAQGHLSHPQGVLGWGCPGEVTLVCP